MNLISMAIVRRATQKNKKNARKMTHIINKEYLESLLEDPIRKKAQDIANLLVERAKLGFRYVSVCGDRRKLFDNNQLRVITLLKTMDIKVEAEEGYPFTCSCGNVSAPCRYGIVFYF